MPGDKKNQKRNDAKEQRKPRRGRHKEAAAPKIIEKSNETKEVPKVTVPQTPVYDSPGPEFYKSLKRETDEIIKITEEESSKYKKKEIQSNWSKYEMPIESYEEVEEQENLGADYEQLIQAPLSVGGHFQFKHEKSWDVNTGPSLYEKYFEINMNNLCLAISTIPFYERNSLDTSTFSESDMLSMNNRATRFKQKYYNDKSYTTPEIEAQENILRNLRDDKQDNSSEIEIQEELLHNMKEDFEKTKEISDDKPFNIEDEINLNNKIDKSNDNEKSADSNLDRKDVDIKKDKEKSLDTALERKEEIRTKKSEIPETSKDNIRDKNSLMNDDILDNKFDTTNDFIFEKAETTPPTQETKNESKKIAEIKPTPKVAAKPQEANKPVIESPEDLEKWLDDFLDG